ncbi:Enoyl-CoA hydratase [Caenispirillum bisanense]|uniref:Enoyl-CoA hydratase n=1 Tax=Caenispirillum bisanense TaxID=414052 RepID=A0A286GL85_9PROT|nr:Enoyl-CoA hydratase [Caenispirillum bisanense]
MPETVPVLLARQGPIARIRFNRPAALNALDEATAVAFRDACRAVAADRSVRCVLVEGEGRAFMAGGDIGRFGGTPDESAAAVSDIILPLHDGLLTLRRQDAPVVAALQGAVAGAGMSLALACDLAIAAEDARFVFAYTAIGTTPDGSGSFFLPRLVGLRRAMEIALLGEPINAARALELGLVSQVVPTVDLESAALALAERLAAGPTAAYGRVRRLYERSFGATLADQLEAEREAFMASTRTRDFAEGCRAFTEKRRPQFHGE